MASACSWEKRRTSQKLSSKKIMVNTNVMVWFTVCHLN
ncbi:hypothetical protein LRLP16767_LR202_01457 [Limosilactobacillus reuteri]|uniref:Uncharacterized protein n=1 Tax=Limosilactobacillus reuteri TaxID=1598 RepID=A0A0U5JVE1_LIMRT|nr:hypothetical protein LRLP16767_LR3C6_00806 [Limosilactobacillus reuteri subsp. porcinus]CUR41415.1 hypothetical protein LRLP16767_LR202_01457 [Limosilactobacillus reuteri]